MNKLDEKLTKMRIKTHCAMKKFAEDISGSESTEKIGMVVIAVLVVAALAAVMNKVMPDIFTDIANKAKEKLGGIMDGI